MNDEAPLMTLDPAEAERELAALDPELLEPHDLGEEEIEPDPETLEAVLAGDSELLQRALTAILFLEPEPLTPARLGQALGLSVEAVEAGLEAVRVRLQEEGINVITGAGTWRLGTNPAIASVLERYFKKARKRRLSRAMLETLAIIACRGPVTRAEIEDIRQVNSDGIVARCLDLEFIEVMGQKETPGRPLLYGITDEFLRYFGLQSSDQLQQLLPAEWSGLPRQTLLDLEPANEPIPLGEGPDIADPAPDADRASEDAPISSEH